MPKHLSDGNFTSVIPLFMGCLMVIGWVSTVHEGEEVMVHTKRAGPPSSVFGLISIGLVTLALALPMSRAHAQAEIIAGSMAIGDLSASISSDLKSVIAQFENSASITSFRVRSDLIVVADNIRVMGEALADKTFDGLSQQQKTFFENARALATDAKSGVDLTADRVEGILAGMSETMSRVPGLDGRPFVTKYNPSFVLIGKSKYPVSINGTLVGTGSPTLSFGETPCEMKTKTERALEFDCPSSIFSEKDPWSSGQLTVVEKKPWWKFWGTPDTHAYTVSIRSIPDVMGDFLLVARGVQRVEAAKPRTAGHNHRNNHCQGDTPLSFRFTPESGCRIDIQSIRLIRGSISERSQVDGPASVTSTGFMVSAVARNSGACGPRLPGGARAGVDARGSINFNVTWNDVCPENQAVEANVGSGPLRWSQEKAFQLPAFATAFVLTVTQADGKIRVVNGTESTQWFDVAFDAASKVVLFKPKALESAMR